MASCYLIGRGISHSKSAAMYGALFAQLGLDWTYEARDLDTETQARDVLAARDWAMLNATMPYKQLAFEAATVKAATAKLSGGANALLRLGDQVVGLNTDGVGCVRHIQRAGHSLVSAQVAICGTGPTALAIFLACARAGATRICLLGRNRARAKEVLEAFAERYRTLAGATLDLTADDGEERTFRDAFEQTEFLFGTYATSRTEIASADIVIDATPLGMAADDPAPFDAELLGSQKLVYDVVYGHGTTALAEAAQQAGIATLDGSGMLVGQAVENAFALLDAHHISHDLTRDSCFELMRDAAQFAC